DDSCETFDPHRGDHCKRCEKDESGGARIELAPAAEIERCCDGAEEQRGDERRDQLRHGPPYATVRNEVRKNERCAAGRHPEYASHDAHYRSAAAVHVSRRRPLIRRRNMLEAARAKDANKILAIEDDPEVLALYKSFLQKKGYEVLSAAGAVEGISLLQRNPDTRLILLDLNLPGMSGEEWIAWYVQQGKQTPVVVASGKGDILTITKGNNMTAALTKPFHMEELQELIEVLLAENWHEQVSVDKKTH